MVLAVQVKNVQYFVKVTFCEVPHFPLWVSLNFLPIPHDVIFDQFVW
jgi:hypothetical protein